MTNIFTSNAGMFGHSVFQLINLVSSPFQIAMSTYLLYKYIGWASFVGKNKNTKFTLQINSNQFLQNLTKNLHILNNVW